MVGSAYELIDCGAGRKLERFGEVITDRPEVLATGAPALGMQRWKKLRHLYFSDEGGLRGSWSGSPRAWELSLSCGELSWKMGLETSPYKHLGIFPEQSRHWLYMQHFIGKGDAVLNLFAYTGASSICAALCLGEVYHVEISRSTVARAARNAALSGVENIHWVCEDAQKFAQREVKRGHKYRLVLMDPPAVGRSKKGVVWQLEKHLPELLRSAAQLLHTGGEVILNTYTSSYAMEELWNSLVNYGLEGKEWGRLSVSTPAGRSLALSKFVHARKL